MEYVINKDELGLDVITFCAPTQLDLMELIDKYVLENDVSNLTQYAKGAKILDNKIVLIPELNMYNGQNWMASYALNMPDGKKPNMPNLKQPSRSMHDDGHME